MRSFISIHGSGPRLDGPIAPWPRGKQFPEGQENTSRPAQADSSQLILGVLRGGPAAEECWLEVFLPFRLRKLDIKLTFLSNVACDVRSGQIVVCSQKRVECGGDYSGLVSEVPENAATIAGAITIPTKVRPIRRSCMGVFLLVGFDRSGSELIHTMIMTQVTDSRNPTSTLFQIKTVVGGMPPRRECTFIGRLSSRGLGTKKALDGA
jgi:hypothetical protein